MIKSILISLCCLLMFSNITTGQTLKQQAQTKINTLNALITAAESEGIDAYKEKMTVRTAEIYLDFADWDEANVAENTTYFDLVTIYKDSAEDMAELLPDFEREEVILMLDEAIVYLTKLKNGQVFRKPIPKVDWADITHNDNELSFNNRPVFLADYTWKPGTPFLQEYHGNQDGFFLSPAHVLDSSGTLKASVVNQLNSKPTGTAGFIFLNNKGVRDWMVAKYGSDFKMRENTYTNYDIDNPGAKEMMGFLLDQTVPKMVGKKYTQLGYMLCNEPHFYTQANVWATGPVSHHTIDKFKIWLENKHDSIAALNALWNTSFNSFNDVSITIPINGNLQGTPIWYDWVNFNMYRVTAWYQFVKARIRQSDPNAKVHLKIMPHLWSENTMDHGIDLEALTRMSEIIGNDAGSWNNHLWGPTEWWEADYAFAWRDMTMPYDFMKSVSPDKIFYNTEAHYLSKGKSRDLYEDPPYTRATYWLAHTLGLNASQTWFWARREDGSIRNNSGKGYAGSNNQQPRIVNELHSTVMDLNSFSEEITALQQQAKPLRIFYSKTSAINKTEHMDDVFELYEALSFEGTSLGFATQDIINTQNDSAWEAILIYETEYVTQDELSALQSYLDNGGTIIKDHVSLAKDEYGASLPALIASNGTLTLKNAVPQLKAEALAILSTKGLLPEVTLSETNRATTPGCHWKCIRSSSGNNILSIVNMGNTHATLDIRLNGASRTYCKDLIQGISSPSTVTLAPFQVFFAEVSDTSLVSIGNLIDSKSGINMYPNPSTGQFQIDFTTLQKKVDLCVFDVSGKSISTKKYRNVQQIEHDISAHPNGNYIIQVHADADTVRRVLVKN